MGDGDMRYYVPVDDGWEEVLGRNVLYTLRPSTSLQMPNIELHHPGIEPGPPPDRMWKLYH
jgi:hypothetical protein